MAAAFGMPVVVLFGPSDPVVWAPWRTANEVLVDKADIERISPEEVIARSRPSEGARMSELRRLLFREAVLVAADLSVVLMAIAGAAHANDGGSHWTDLRPGTRSVFARTPVELFKLPFSTTPLYLHQLAPQWIHNVWNIVAFAILCVFLVRGCVRLLRQLPGELGRRQRRHRYPPEGLRQAAAARRPVLRVAFDRPDHVVRHERHRQDPDRHVEHAGRLAASDLLGHLRCSSS